MSVASEIDRIEKAKGDIRTAIENQGETVPAEETIDKYAAHINNISGGRENLLVNSDFNGVINIPGSPTQWPSSFKGQFLPKWGTTGGLNIGFISNRDSGLYVEKVSQTECKIYQEYGSNVSGFVRSHKMRLEIYDIRRTSISQDFVMPEDGSEISLTLGDWEISVSSWKISLWPKTVNTRVYLSAVFLTVLDRPGFANQDVSRVKSFGYSPVLATADMTQPVGVKNGKFFTTPDAISKIRGASVGDLIKVKSVDSAGTPTALEKTSLEELEGKWELIETIPGSDAVIERDKTPTGTPYRYRSLAVLCDNPSGLSFRYGIIFSANGSVSLPSLVMDSSNKKALNSVITIHGFLNGLSQSGPNEFGYTETKYLGSRYQFSYSAPITAFKTNAVIPTGATITIWAVRT